MCCLSKSLCLGKKKKSNRFWIKAQFEMFLDFLLLLGWVFFNVIRDFWTNL